MAQPRMTDREAILRIVEEQPEDSTFDEILRELVFSRMVERGLEDAERGRTIGHDEIGARLSS